MQELAPAGRLLGQVALAAYIYLGVFAVIVIVASIALVRYFSKKKNAPEGSEEQKVKNFSFARVGLVLLVIMLLLIAAPIVYIAITG